MYYSAKIQLEERLDVDDGELLVIEPLVRGDAAAVLRNLNDTRAPLPALAAVRAVADTAAVARPHTRLARVEPALVVDVVVAQKGRDGVLGGEEGGKEARVDVGVVDALKHVARAAVVAGVLVLEERDVEEGHRAAEAALADLELGGLLEVPSNLAGADPVVAGDAGLLRVGARVKEEQVKGGGTAKKVSSVIRIS